MCGICFICGFLVPPLHLENQIRSYYTLLNHRGPDAHEKKTLSVNDEVNALFEGCVLWLQGRKPTSQPLIDQNGNILLWNGDILAGFEIPRDQSDTEYLSDELATKEEREILSFLGVIKGPWSLIYFQKKTKRLYFGRDIFGRHSLLWQLPSEAFLMFMISSVCRQNECVKEIPALGLFYIDFFETNLKVQFTVHLIPWSHAAEESLMCLDPVIKVKEHKIISCIRNTLDMCIPSDTILEDIKSLPSTLDGENTKILHLAFKSDIENLLKVLTNSIQRRVDKSPLKCRNCTDSQVRCDHSRIAVLFSGGLDSAMIALLLDSCLMESESVDLLNVAFLQRVSQSNEVKKKCKVKNSSVSGNNPIMNYEVPDRISGRQCWQQLQEIRPLRKWNFVEINVKSDELAQGRQSNISHLVAPQTSVLDDSIGCALWFAGRQGSPCGKSEKFQKPKCIWSQGFRIRDCQPVLYIFISALQNILYCHTKVLLCGMGADEQLGGYSRHRGRFLAGGWSALLEEINMEISRIHTRNLGRDNRILADHGRAPRFPYLDEDVVSTLNSLPIWIKANLQLPRGVGEKFILRVAAAHLGLSSAAGLPKRAIQFGSRIAKLENSKEKGSDSCERLMQK
ncbi:asparagine synthetase domain-containing protein 1-like [Homarus americanus]|uniref:asparagine synthetase domain-containing protein 1-like n=1 Tax=Homarus americanus TaxID=6706 RepID=UPI001C466EAF|nr:asparagine synthetase domain-containing protein 1-like [Homarus americanus]